MKTIPVWKSPYGCYNQPRPVKGTPLPVQNGWEYIYIENRDTRVPNMETVPFVMEEPCMYDRSDADAFCKGCQHTNSARKIKDCDHDWHKWPVARIEGTEWCVRCGDTRPDKE